VNVFSGADPTQYPSVLPPRFCFRTRRAAPALGLGSVCLDSAGKRGFGEMLVNTRHQFLQTNIIMKGLEREILLKKNVYESLVFSTQSTLLLCYEGWTDSLFNSVFATVSLLSGPGRCFLSSCMESRYKSFRFTGGGKMDEFLPLGDAFGGSRSPFQTKCLSSRTYCTDPLSC